MKRLELGCPKEKKKQHLIDFIMKSCISSSFYLHIYRARGRQAWSESQTQAAFIVFCFINGKTDENTLSFLKNHRRTLKLHVPVAVTFVVDSLIVPVKLPAIY